MEGFSRLGLSAIDYTGHFLKQNQFPFQTPVFFSDGVRIRHSFYSMKDLFLKIKGFRILLNQGDQLLIGLIKILQASKRQDHLIVQIRVVL